MTYKVLDPERVSVVGSHVKYVHLLHIKQDYVLVQVSGYGTVYIFESKLYELLTSH